MYSNAYWEIGIIFCSCGRNTKSSQSPTELDQNNHDVTSIPGYVIKKNSSRGAKHGPCERQRMYYQAKQMLKKARQQKHGRHPTILSRWYGDESSLYAIGWREKQIMFHDRIALEKHIYVATRAERTQNSKHLDSHDKVRRRTSAITHSTTRLCSSEKRMQTIARRAPGKDPRRMQNHSSQSTGKTARRTTNREQRKIRLRG